MIEWQKNVGLLHTDRHVYEIMANLAYTIEARTRAQSKALAADNRETEVNEGAIVKEGVMAAKYKGEQTVPPHSLSEGWVD